MACYWDDESVAVEEYQAAVRAYCLAGVRGCGEAVSG